MDLMLTVFFDDKSGDTKVINVPTTENGVDGVHLAEGVGSILNKYDPECLQKWMTDMARSDRCTQELYGHYHINSLLGRKTFGLAEAAEILADTVRSLE